MQSGSLNESSGLQPHREGEGTLHWHGCDTTTSCGPWGASKEGGWRDWGVVGVVRRQALRAAER